MNCERYSNLIDDWVEGELDGQTAAPVEAHVFGCSRCRAQAEILRREREIYARFLFDAEPPPDLWTSFQTRLAAEQEKARRVADTPAQKPHRADIFGFLRFSPALPAAVLLIGFAVGFGWLKFAPDAPIGGKDFAKTEPNDAPPPFESSAPDASKTTDSTTKPESSASGVVEKNPEFGNGSKPGRALKISAAGKKSTAGETVKIERKTIRVVAPKNAPAPKRTNEKEPSPNRSMFKLETEIAGQIERVELLLRSFRNARAVEAVETFDVEYEKGQARRLLGKNERLRRDAENHGISYAVELLSRVEPYLLDIANLEDNPAPDKVLDIRERVKNQSIIASLQTY